MDILRASHIVCVCACIIYTVPSAVIHLVVFVSWASLSEMEVRGHGHGHCSILSLKIPNYLPAGLVDVLLKA